MPPRFPSSARLRSRVGRYREPARPRSSRERKDWADRASCLCAETTGLFSKNEMSWRRHRRILFSIEPQHSVQTGRIQRVGLREVHASRLARSERARRIRHRQQTVRFIAMTLWRMFGRTAIWLVLTVTLATLSMAAPQELPEGEGKKLLEERCAGCHSLKPVVSLKQSQGAWKELIVKMVGNGAQLDGKEVDVATEY